MTHFTNFYHKMSLDSGVVLTTVLLFSFLSTPIFAAKWLDNFVSYYEVSDNSDFLLHRSRRSIANSNDGGFIYPIRAFNRTFILILQEDNSIFSPDHEIDDGESIYAAELPVLVIGTVQGIGDSFVHGSLINYRFEGEIRIGDDFFMIENAEKFLPDMMSNGKNKASVVYRSNDVTLDAHHADNLLSRRKRSETATDVHEYSLCGWSNEKIREELNSKQKDSGNEHYAHFDHFHDHEDSMYSETANRVKRAATLASDIGQPGLLSDVNKLFNKPKVCVLFMQVDHLLYDKYLKQANSPVCFSQNSLLIYFNHCLFHIA